MIVEISYLTYRQIDKSKWDACIAHAGNGLIYGYSVYLDAMARHWDALVLCAGSGGGDYEAVMPLTHNRKYSIHYLYQPPFAACLGVFGKDVHAETVQAFLKAIPAKFKYWDIYFNPGNCFSIPGFSLYQRMNFVLDLHKDYDSLYQAYRDNVKRNIKKSEQFGLSIQRNIPVSEVVSLVKEHSIKPAASAGDLARFETLYHSLYEKQQATTYAVYTQKKQLVAAAVFFFSHARAYYILVANHPNGKTLGASHALINAFIKDHAGQNILLDFEGSDVPGLAFFYSSFGAVEEKYSAIKLNRLPALLKWIKK